MANRLFYDGKSALKIEINSNRLTIWIEDNFFFKKNSDNIPDKPIQIASTHRAGQNR